MSDIVASFDPSAAPQTSFTVPQTAVNGALVFWNESNIALNISLQNGSTFYLPAWYNKHLCGYSGSVNVSWNVRAVLNSGLPPLSEIIVEAYASGEHFPADGSLVRQTNGDTNSNVTTTQNTLINDGSAPTVIIEATVAGDTTSAVSITNDAQVVLGNATHAANVTVTGFSSLGDVNIFGLLHMIAQSIELDNSQSISWFDTAAVLRSVLGLSNTNKVIISGMNQFLEIRDQSNAVHFSFDVINNIIQFPAGGFSLTGPSGLAILQTSLTNTYVDGNNSVNLQVASTTVLNVLSNSINCLQRINLPLSGGLSSTAIGSGVSVAGTVIHINHGLGINPDWCGAAVFSTSSTATLSWTWNSTQINVLCSVGGLTISCAAYKF